jgi:hypothetical protein
MAEPILARRTANELPQLPDSDLDLYSTVIEATLARETVNELPEDEYAQLMRGFFLAEAQRY